MSLHKNVQRFSLALLIMRDKKNRRESHRAANTIFSTKSRNGATLSLIQGYPQPLIIAAQPALMPAPYGNPSERNEEMEKATKMQEKNRKGRFLKIFFNF